MSRGKAAGNAPAAGKIRAAARKGVVMSRDFLPVADARFERWLASFVAYAGAHQKELHLTAGDLSGVSTGLKVFAASLAAHLAARQAARAKAAAKRAAQRAAAGEVRQLVRRLQADPRITNDQREGLGITIAKKRAPVPEPTSQPLVQVELIGELRHVLRITDSGTQRSAKPPGVRGAEIWMRVVSPGEPAPMRPEDLMLVDIATQAHITRAFGGDDAGKMAYYRLRWVNTRGGKGPWGMQVGATVAV